MSKLQTATDLSELREQLLSWLENRLDETPLEWLREKCRRIEKDAEDWEVFSSFSAVPRHTGKESLSLTQAERQRAGEIRVGWMPGNWSADQVGRTLLMLALAERDKDEFLEKLEKIFNSSDMGEAIALYQSLAVLPYPESLTGRAAEGIRSNITSVFNAVALNNPYPADYLDEEAWNQMVLKALFVGSPLYPIQGLDRRANKKLATMLVDYAHERWAAGRTVSPELWRPVGPFAEGRVLDDLEKALSKDDPVQQRAAALALTASPDPAAQDLLKEYPDLLKAEDENEAAWEWIGRKAEENN